MSDNLMEQQAREIANLQAWVQDLSARLEHVEAELRATREHQEISEQTLLAISAAVAAYLGKRAKVKHVHFAGKADSSWASQGRSHIQQSHVIRPVH